MNGNSQRTRGPKEYNPDYEDDVQRGHSGDSATFSELRNAVAKLVSKTQQALDLDEAELQDGMSKTYATDCAHKKEVRETADRIAAELREQVDRLNELVSTNFARADGVPDQLRNETAARWQHIQNRLAALKTKINTDLRLDDWKGTAGDSYRTMLPTQSNAIDELSALTDTNSRATDQVAQLNAAILAAARTSTDNVTYSLKVQPPAHIDQGWLLGNKEPYKLNYYSRSTDAKARIRQLCDWMEQVTNDKSAPWVGSANGIGTYIDANRKAPRNLIVDGTRWPDQHTKAKRVGEQSRQTTGDTEVDSTTTQGEDGGVRMRKNW